MAIPALLQWATGFLMRPVCPGFEDVHAWVFSLDLPSAMQERFSTFLSPAEQARAKRFKFPDDRRHYVAAHGYLRRILSHYCQVEPHALILESLPSGKPRVIGAGKLPEMEFNLTHSHGRGAVAVACGRAVGIDLEKVRVEVDCRRLASRYFSAQEQSSVFAASEQRLPGVFLRHWVGKEAYLKGIGVGLQFPLDQCEVILTEAEERAVIRCQGETGFSEAWTVRYLPLEEEWIGGVASQGDQWMVTVCSVSTLGE